MRMRLQMSQPNQPGSALMQMHHILNLYGAVSVDNRADGAGIEGQPEFRGHSPESTLHTVIVTTSGLCPPVAPTQRV